MSTTSPNVTPKAQADRITLGKGAWLSAHVPHAASGIRRLAAALALAMVATGAASAQTQQLPIETFLNLLGPTANTLWVDPSSGNFLRIDAFGKVNNFLSLNLGTSVTGRVMVRDLGDGTQQVTVIIHTRDAICWGFNSSNQPAFGYSPVNVRDGVGPAALGQATTVFVFEPQPVGPISLGNIESLVAAVTCNGVLRAGSGYPAGTPGIAHTTQVGVVTGVPSGCPPEVDANCFPAEKVVFKPAGN